MPHGPNTQEADAGEFEASLLCKVCSRIARTTQRSPLEKSNNNNNNKRINEKVGGCGSVVDQHCLHHTEALYSTPASHKRAGGWGRHQSLLGEALGSNSNSTHTKKPRTPNHHSSYRNE